MQAAGGAAETVPFNVERVGGSLIAGLPDWAFGVIIGVGACCCCLICIVIAIVLVRSKRKQNQVSKRNIEFSLSIESIALIYVNDFLFSQTKVSKIA